MTVTWEALSVATVKIVRLCWCELAGERPLVQFPSRGACLARGYHLFWINSDVCAVGKSRNCSVTVHSSSKLLTLSSRVLRSGS